MKLAEAQLDAVLAEALADRGEFSRWFLHQTRFGNESAECVFVRSDNPWSSVKLETPNSVDGELESLLKQCETDILAVYQTIDGRRLAIHIENKLATGSFTPHQPQLYKERLQQWKNRPKLGNYSEATSVLVAPRIFYDRHLMDANMFECYISHEELSTHLSAFGLASRAGV